MRHEDAILERNIHPLAPIPTGETPTGLSNIRWVKAMIFDVYGTLVISGSGDMDSLAVMSHRQKQALAGMLRRYGIDGSPEKLVASLRTTLDKNHDRLRQEGIDFPEVDIVRVWETVLGKRDTAWLKAFALEYEMIVNPVYPMPGLEDLLSAGRRQGLLLGIISNAQFFTPPLLERLLGASLDRCGFDPQLIFFSYRVGSAKPSRFMFELAVEVLSHRGVPPASVLYVGNDMRNDILPAKAVGFQTALFAGDRRSLRRRADDVCCGHLVPDVIVTDLRQLIVDTDNP
jgi:putative hydrolase of the HAD superfamily